MKWIKKGLIYCAENTRPWALSHAALPTPFRLNDTSLRIYCAFRAGETISRIGYVDVAADDPTHVLGVSAQPVLDIGTSGNFDDHGVLPTSIVRHDEQLYLYYAGFELRTDVPYTMFTGLAISRDGGQSFARHQQTPILAGSQSERHFRTAPCVLKENGVWKMWYIAGSSWITHEGKTLPVYTVKYLESADGIGWNDEGQTCLHLEGDEHGFGRPYVMRDAHGYKMYYSVRTRTKGYRLGYAESIDGLRWTRKDDEMGLEVSPDGWDSESVCYCAIAQHRDKTYLFYNGNRYGETGFGYAELSS